MEHEHTYTHAVHHTDEDGKHFCPTGFMYCDTWPECDVWGVETEPFQCVVWDRVPDHVGVAQSVERDVANVEAAGS